MLWRMRLTEKRIKGLGPGRYVDDPTLCLVVTRTGGRSWVQRLMVNGRRVDRGLGGWPVVTLAEARLTALSNRRAVRSGVDPFTNREPARPTFRQAAERTLAANADRWSESTIRTWIGPLANHVFALLGARKVDSITRADVVEVLRPIWATKPAAAETALKRIRLVLDWAMASGHVAANVAANGGIKAALPSRERTRTHHRALGYQEIPKALRTILASGAAESAKACAALIVLTAARSAEARGATWQEFDLTASTWTIPADRMKSKRPHVVPLAPAAVAILKVRAGRHERYPFASERTGRPLSDMGLGAAIKGLDATIHGFRSTFRDWASEETDCDHAVAELCLAHAVGSQVERAYRRGALIEKRRALMTAWASYCYRD